ncbi:flagellar basal-body MS-ring/collar protein FliF [Dethiosulfatarculus sandiegensis]|uniref:Flagellar M-ring protein n=1 Tax=Dethiosulfatarculus sandiegensis TaxID=1429043 RepID=A0A0D2HZV7_9BACT|nr:flagellar basal-body MS-ring/collar protein FliF [Dethiosulfatarculus sandiegensis]KIX15823.1 flagellar M-ring protein FliF [Dethiosulfatarculus sandiegensis]
MAEAEEKQAKLGGGVGQAFNEMSMGRKLALMGAAALVVGGFIALLLWVNKPTYQVLYSGLSAKDASGVVEKLKELKVPYQLEGSGTIVKIPDENLYETRLAMASAGLPQSGGVGFEIFNEVKIGTTEFMQKVNYQRALEGELARTIASFAEVDEARVHLVLPRESLFIEDQKKPSASVVLRLSGGNRLKKQQIEGIVYLVSSAVPDLVPEDVTVVDNKGNLLYRKEADTENFPAALTASQLEHQRTVENTLKGKVQSMLEEVLGPGRAVVRVTADMDYTQVSSTEQKFDPEQVAVRSETRSSEKNKDAGPLPQGAPDQRFNLATRNATPGEEGEGNLTSERENETTNFEISNSRRVVRKSMGEIKRLSLAVMVDGPYSETTGANGEVTRTFTPRSAGDMQQLEGIVRRAVGYNEQRGDELSLVNVPFALPDGVGTAAAKDWQDYLFDYARPAMNVLLVLLFFLFVVRPVMKHLFAKPAPTEAAPGMAQRVGPGEALPPGEAEEMAPEMLEAMEGPRKLTTRDMILTLAQQDPEKATAVLRAWIHEAT